MVDNYIHQSARVPSVTPVIRRLTLAITFGPLVASILAGGASMLLLHARVQSHFALVASLVVVFVVGTTLLYVSRMLEGRTLSNNAWLASQIDSATSKLKEQIFYDLADHEMFTSPNNRVNFTQHDLIRFRNGKTVRIHPVTPSLVRLKLQLAAMEGLELNQRMSISNYGFTDTEIHEMSASAHDSMKYHLVCYIDMPQRSLDNAGVHTCRYSDLALQLMTLSREPATDDSHRRFATNNQAIDHHLSKDFI